MFDILLFFNINYCTKVDLSHFLFIHFFKEKINNNNLAKRKNLKGSYFLNYAAI